MVDVPKKVYAVQIARQLPKDGDAESALERMHTDDLYLADACARGDAQAVAAFERCCMSAVDDALARERVRGDAANEIKQRIRERVLVAGARSAGIERFSGRASLRSWLSVIATREAIALKRRAARDVPIDELRALHAFVTSEDEEMVQLKLRHRELFRRSFDAALRALPSRDQTLLRQHVLDGLSIDRLGALYCMHRSTAARRLERVRAGLLKETRARMRKQLEVNTAELDSILRMIRSRLDVNLGALLRSRAERRQRRTRSEDESARKEGQEDATP